MKVTGGWHLQSFGLWVAYYNLRGNGRYIDVFMPFCHLTISWGVHHGA